MMTAERQLIAACRNLLAEYEPVLEAVRAEIAAEHDRAELAKGDAFEVARQAIRREAVKEGMQALIGRIKTYGSKRPE